MLEIFLAIPGSLFLRLLFVVDFPTRVISQKSFAALWV